MPSQKKPPAPPAVAVSQDDLLAVFAGTLTRLDAQHLMQLDAMVQAQLAETTGGEPDSVQSGDHGAACTTPRQCDAAMCTVLSTAELLEQILTGLEIHELLAAQLVSRHWQTVIDTSITLRQLMFLAPRKLASRGVSAERSMC